MFFDHVEIDSLDFASAVNMYPVVLSQILQCEVSESDDEVIFFVGDVSFFLIRNSARKAGTHIAFTVPTTKKVDEAHALAVESGFVDNGPPGPREDYGPNYYAAFLLDLDGNNIEFICRSR